jgi:hypothetical protein
MGSPLINSFIQNYKEANNFYNGLETDANEILALEKGVAQGNVGDEQQMASAWDDLQQLQGEYSSLMTGPDSSASSQLSQVQSAATTLLENTAVTIGTDDSDFYNYIWTNNSGTTILNLYQLLSNTFFASYSDTDGDTFQQSDLESMASQGQLGISINYDPNGYTYNNFTNALAAFQSIVQA